MVATLSFTLASAAIAFHGQSTFVSSQPRVRIVTASASSQPDISSPPPPTATVPKDSKPRVVLSLASLAGFADVIVFRQFGCFANMMTGNTIQGAAALSQCNWIDASFSATVLLSYVIGVGSYRAVDVKASGRLAASRLSPVVLLLFALPDAVLLLSRRHTRWVMPLVAAGSGVVNAVSSESGSTITSMGTRRMVPGSVPALAVLLFLGCVRLAQFCSWHLILTQSVSHPVCLSSVTGHLSKIANYVTDRFALGQPTTGAQRQSGNASIQVVAAFIAGVVGASVLLRGGPTSAALLPGPLPVFSLLGLAYAGVLLIVDRDARRTELDASCDTDVLETICQ